MSTTLIAHKCNCFVKLPYMVDKESENVYHETCEGYIGHVTDFEPLEDSFWNDQLESRENAVVINGTQYRIGSTPYPKKGYGFGGDEFAIKMKDTGEVIKTRDLWHQGDLPEAYKPFVLDNASFVRKIEVK